MFDKYIKRYSEYLPHYLPLMGIFVAGIVGFLLFSYDQYFQIAVSISLVSAYATWGIIHHYIHDDLSFEIVVEYIAMAGLGLAILLSLIFRS